MTPVPASVASAINWLDRSDDAGVRYLTARDLAGAPAAELLKRKRAAHAEGAIPAILSRMKKQGYWEKPGAGYYPKYTGSVWSLVTLAQLGADSSLDERIGAACGHILEHGLAEGGQFSVNGAASGTADCLQGNLCAALVDLGCRDPRLDHAFDWMARSVTGEGIASMKDKEAPVRYYAGKCGPNFACGANNKLPCAWGAVKVMFALAGVPVKQRTPVMTRAIQAGVDFLLAADPAKAEYPCGWAPKPSGNWWKFGFPVFYITDILQIGEVFARLGMAGDKRLTNLNRLIESKQGPDGAWALEYDYAGKIWSDFGAKKSPNPWVTLRAARVLKAADA